ncbi:hypothetical protein [uncultured Chryseobacterium sp.]|uniref:hypothetical protein n=1 Tax=uncultured Chryseobacterium sp. TaxID=259322 RepID=UPI0025CDE76E|nr:hypothetical protein [uncultured Chryseobacterium sp.]
MGFNDLYLTNGFHPLWMFFCIIGEFLNPFDKSFLLYIVWFFQVLLIFFGIRLLEKFIFKSDGIGKIFSFSFYTILFFSLGTLYLTEAHLAFFTIALLLFFIAKSYKNDLVFGVICSLVFMARLDLIFLIFPLGFLYWHSRSLTIKSILKMFFGFSILTVPYLYSNYIIFNDLVPISGKIKSSFPTISNDIPFVFLTNFCLFTGILYLIFLLLFKNIQYRNLKVCFLAGCLIHLFYNLFYQDHIGQWYFVPQFMLFGFFINDIFKKANIRFLQKSKIITIITAFAAIFICFLGFMKLITNLSISANVFNKSAGVEKKQQDGMRIISEVLSKSLPANARIYVYDFPGKFAFFSDLNFVPADALVANLKFFNEINELKFSKYLKKNDIHYLLLPSVLSRGENTMEFMGVIIKKVDHQNFFYIRNTLSHKIVDTLSETQLNKIKEFENPAKTWQKRYDSISIYRLK